MERLERGHFAVLWGELVHSTYLVLRHAQERTSAILKSSGVDSPGGRIEHAQAVRSDSHSILAILATVGLLSLSVGALTCREAPREPMSSSNASISIDGGGEYVSLLSVNDLNLELNPCFKAFRIEVEPKVNLLELMSEAQAVGYGDTYTLALDFNLSIEGASGVIHRARQIRSVQDSYFDSPWEETSLGAAAFDWNGLAWSNENLTVAPAGNYEFSLTIDAMKLEIEANQPNVLDTYERITVDGVITVSTASSACQAWVASAASFGESPGKTVVIDGYDTGAVPDITWYDGYKARRIFGNLETKQAGETFEDTVKRFLDNHDVLFGNLSGASIAGISQEELIAVPAGSVLLPGNFHFVKFRQVVPGTALRIYERGLSAIFDDDGRLLRVFGVLGNAVPTTPPSASLSHADAIDVVEQSLLNKGLSTNRLIDVLHEVAVEISPTEYELAAVVAVDIVENDSHSKSYTYVVSLLDGQIIDSELTVSEHSAEVTKWERDPELSYYYNNSNLDGNGNQLPDTGNLEWQKLQDSVQVYDDGVKLVLSDVQHGGVINKVTELGVYDAEPIWPSGTSHLHNTSPINMTDEFVRLELITVYTQAQKLWNLLSPWVGDGWEVNFKLNDPDLEELGVYISRPLATSEVRTHQNIYPQLTGKNQRGLHTATHEFFHALDGHSVRLRDSDPSDGDYAMQGALKEGLAEWWAIAMDGKGVSIDESQGLQNIICVAAAISLLGSNGANSAAVQSCNQWELYYKKPGYVGLLGRPVMTEPQITSTWPDWPDCRAESIIDASWTCPVIRTPPPPLGGAGGVIDGPRPNTWEWKGDLYEFLPSVEYGFISYLMIEMWEDMANTLYRMAGETTATALAQDFFRPSMLGFIFLDRNASFIDFRDAMEDAVTLWVRGSGLAGFTRSVVDRTFDHHGIDTALRDFCWSNSEMCR